MLLSYLLLMVCILVAVAFFTLLERKVLGYAQLRKGPNKVSFLGVPQPLADAVKLFVKELAFPLTANLYPYFLAPVLSLFLSLALWVTFPFESFVLSFFMGMILFLCCTSMSVYGTLIAGWASNSKYALLGALRSVAQTVSYEVSLALVLLGVVLFVGHYNMSVYGDYQYLVWHFLLLGPLGLVWFVSCLAETNRAPFDFAEGESELVSGFNVEYSGGGFALIFMAEYGSIIFMSFLVSLLFFGGMDLFLGAGLSFSLKIGLVCFVFLWVRGCYPRMRYDQLMYLAWKGFLPLALNYFVVGLVAIFLFTLV
uniref:NADH-ubiquinone oxidoreductase chain 1 n=1 Tax=Halicryptus spinulosus TaxID=160677 RepID=L0N7R8_9BILA|nr:NADH dehydrogenase subunit 1 [Halicryptus spinulosus]CBK55560.1 NADH dehydrogenase subunit I [Halicryptus spinulosus]